MISLVSKTVSLRLIEPSDAKFVLSLRLNARYNQFLSSVQPDLEMQKQWIVNYKIEEALKKQFYFIIERNDGVPCGTVRVYDIREDTFCWGSWILNEDKTRFAALEAALLVYDFGFYELGFQKSHFEVIIQNERVVNFHKKMGAIETKRDDKNIYFEISKATVDEFKIKMIDKVI